MQSSCTERPVRNTLLLQRRTYRKQSALELAKPENGLLAGSISPKRFGHFFNQAENWIQSLKLKRVRSYKSRSRSEIVEKSALLHILT